VKDANVDLGGYRNTDLSTRHPGGIKCRREGTGKKNAGGQDLKNGK
jgi:hypothetical protein